MAEKIYRKLTGRGSRPWHLLTSYTLWVGPDHLLQVESSGYTEEYKRFFYKDIQSVVLCRTPRARYWNIFFLSMIITGALFLLTSSSVVPQILWGNWTLVFSLSLILNLLFGSTASCILTTAVQQEQLPSVKRLRKGRKVVAAIRERVEGAQGLMSTGEVVARASGEEPPVDITTPPGAEPPFRP